MTDRSTFDGQPAEAQALLAGILAITADAIISIDEAQLITLFNDGAEAVFGYRRDEMIGQPIEMLLPERFRARHAEHVRGFGRLAVSARRMGERQVIYARHKDGREFPAEASISHLELGGRRIYTVVLRDVSERRQAEEIQARIHAELEQRVAERTVALSAEIGRREETQAQLVRTQRMEAFGQLTGGVAHDFNNLLTVISGNLELLEMRLTDERDRTLVKRAQDAAEMGARLTSRLLTFARRRQFESASLDLNEQIMGMVELLRRALGEHIHLSTSLSPGLWLVRADPSEIENAILNLAINARDAMPRGGRLAIETGNVVIEDEQVGAIEKLPAGAYVRLAVTDTGTGMAPEVMQRAFEPFFTTKPPGKGTGLGLSTIYGFVRGLGGGATVCSREGQGTEVSLYLPRQEQASAPARDRSAAAVPVSAGETVLVIEDHAEVREVTRRHLADLGYRVLGAESGPAGLEVLRSSASVDLVLSDVVMAGGLSGIDVARQVAAEMPSVKVLLMSGYAEDALREQGAEALRLRILRKPYSRGELARALRQALEADA